MRDDAVNLNPVERADAVGRVLDEPVPARREIERLLARLGVPRNPRSLGHYLALSRAPDRIRSMVASGTLTFHAFVLMNGMEEGDRDSLLDVIDGLRLGHNYQRELIRMSSDIAAGRGTSVARVLSERELHDIVEDEGISVPDRVKRFFSVLRRLRSRTALTVKGTGEENS